MLFEQTSADSHWRYPITEGLPIYYHNYTKKKYNGRVSLNSPMRPKRRVNEAPSQATGGAADQLSSHNGEVP